MSELVMTHGNNQSNKIRKKYPYIDILRGLAVLGVVAVHSNLKIKDLNIIVASIFNYGQLGVQLFFVASAITLCLSSTQRSEKSPINFYIRRFFRIAPLFYLAILFYFAWRVCIEYYKIGSIAIPENYNLRGVIGTVFFVHGFDPENFNFVVPGGWSIAAEMSFYAIFPILYFLQLKYQRSKFIIFSSSVFLMCLLIKNFLIFNLQPILIEKGFINKFVLEYDFLGASILNQICVFLIGIICYQYIYSEGKALNLTNKMATLAFPLMALSCYLLNSKSYIHTPFTGLLYPVISAIAFSLIAIKLSTINEFTGVASKILIEVGKVSFSMYISHFFILDVVAFMFQKLIFNYIELPEIKLVILYPTVLLLTFFFSRLTYDHIEKKGIKFGNRLIEKLNQRKRFFATV